MPKATNRTADCLFAVRAFVAKCPKCDETLENYVEEEEFNEVATPFRIGTVVRCKECKQYVQITNSSALFQKRFRGTQQGIG